MSNEDIYIRFRHVPKGIELCLQSALDFANDAKILLQINGSASHAFALIIHGFEELTKAKVLRDEYVRYRCQYFAHSPRFKKRLKIPVSKALFRQHSFKLKEMFGSLLSELDLREEFLRAASQLTQGQQKQIRETRQLFKHLMKEGERWRRAALYVGYTDNWLQKREFDKVYLEKLLKNLEANINYLTSQSKGFKI